MENNELLIAAFQSELEKIGSWWTNYTVDETYGGFYGRLTNDNQVVPGAIKGSVLNARILWSFSAAYNMTGADSYLQLARRAFDYIRDHFTDKEHGGLYWSVDASGRVVDAKKQIYAIAFGVYGCSEYYRAGKDPQALDLAVRLYRDIELYSHDHALGGYMEALTREWQPIEDLRLSDKDANEKKTMNTHLHILEAYTNLYRVWPDEELAFRIRGLIGIFMDHIVQARTFHLILFFNEHWELRSDIISYGHDIEASWLLTEAAEVLHDRVLLEKVRALAVRIALAATEGLNGDGSMSYELEGSDHLVRERHWWVQAEAMVGLLNAWQLSGEQHFFDKFLATWAYTQSEIIDHRDGEWYWGRRADGGIMEGEDKAGFWKCPYHNSRACIEVIRRLRQA